MVALCALAGCGVDSSGPSWAEREATSAAGAVAGEGMGDAAGAAPAEAGGTTGTTDAAGTLDGTSAAGSVPSSAPSSVVVIGDSLTESADAEITSALEALGLDVVVDGASSRRLVDDRGVEPGVSALRNVLAYRDPDMFVVALGTNDVASEKSPEEIMADVSEIVALVPPDAPLVWVDVWVHSYQRGSHLANLAIRQALGGRPRTAVVDWWSHGYDEGVIASDGIHLQDAGKTLFADLIAEAVESMVAVSGSG